MSHVCGAVSGWGLALMVLASAPAGLGCRDARSTSARTSPCAHLAAANARVDDVEGGVSLQLRVPDSGLDIITLQDYVSHLGNAWNEAERGVAARCSPVVRTSAGLTSVPSFVVQSGLPDGVQLVFKPVAPGQLDALREYVHHQKQRTISCACEPAR